MNKWETEKEQLNSVEISLIEQIKSLQERLQHLQIRKVYLQGAIDALQETVTE